MTRLALRLTDRAVERYRQWYAPPGTDFEAARIDLETLAFDAYKTGDRSIRGDADLWAIPDSEVQLVVRGDLDGNSGRDFGVVVGLVPPHVADAQALAKMEAEWMAAENARRESEREHANLAAAVKVLPPKQAKKAQNDVESARKKLRHAELEAQALRDLATTERHRLNTVQSQQAKCLRIAIRALQCMSIIDVARHAQAAIAAINPHFVTDEYLKDS